MNAFARGLAVLITTAATLTGAAAIAQGKTVLTNDREKVSYMIGQDVATSIAPVGPDLDVAAFERAVKNAFDGGKPLLEDKDAQAVGSALMQRIGVRMGKAPPGTQAPEVAKDKVGYLVGADVGRSLAGIKEEIELPVLMQSVRTALAKQPSLLPEAEANGIREAFSQRMQAKAQARAGEQAQKNKAEGDAFLAKNKSVKGVFTTPSGLQYMVLRQGSGPRPQATDKVRVNYHGTLLDGTVFDSSYDRGQEAEFPLNQVIAGWTEGVAMMPVGSKFRFWIPGELAYGARGTPGGPIGPNATLQFDVELMAIVP